MVYIISVIAVLALCVLLFFSAGRIASGRALRSPALSSRFVAQNPPHMAKELTREEIAKRLRKLQKSPPPRNLKPGAMCYAAVIAPQRSEYICPVCGERTLYSLEASGHPERIWMVGQDIPRCRTLVKAITGLAVSLDEKEFCRKCSPGAKAPRLTLIIRYPGEEEPRRVPGITSNDLVLLQEFLSGKDRHKDSQDNETPLADTIPRLQELLGVTAK